MLFVLESWNIRVRNKKNKKNLIFLKKLLTVRFHGGIVYKHSVMRACSSGG